MMMGEATGGEAVERAAGGAGPVVFAVNHLRARGDKGVDVLHDLSLEVRSGEILGIAGVSGNGQRELVETLAGQRPFHAGERHGQGRALLSDPRDHAASGRVHPAGGTPAQRRRVRT